MRAFAWPVEPADQVEQRRLAGTGGSHERQEVSPGNVQGHSPQDVDLLRAPVVDLVDIANLHESVVWSHQQERRPRAVKYRQASVKFCKGHQDEVTRALR